VPVWTRKGTVALEMPISFRFSHSTSKSRLVAGAGFHCSWVAMVRALALLEGLVVVALVGGGIDPVEETVAVAHRAGRRGLGAEQVVAAGADRDPLGGLGLGLLRDDIDRAAGQHGAVDRGGRPLMISARSTLTLSISPMRRNPLRSCTSASKPRRL
jgi:hypothetical protein